MEKMDLLSLFLGTVLVSFQIYSLFLLVVLSICDVFLFLGIKLQEHVLLSYVASIQHMKFQYWHTFVKCLSIMHSIKRHTNTDWQMFLFPSIYSSIFPTLGHLYYLLHCNTPGFMYTLQKHWWCLTWILSFFHSLTSVCLLIMLVYRGFLLQLITLDDTHTHTQLVGLHWTRDWPITETSTWQHTTLIRDRHLCLCRYSNMQSPQVSSQTPMPCTAWPPGSADTNHLFKTMTNSFTSYHWTHFHFHRNNSQS